VLNLAINARDAMPDGGRLVIQTENATIDGSATRSEAGRKPGDFVRVSVTDTGIGMPPDVLARAFEPFFTTKEGGRGTGLGLSTIYGFAQQSGGFAQIYSEVGEGTTVNLYLPRADAEVSDVPAIPSEDVVFSENGETILVVEDNDAVREATLQRVESLGYVVLEAAGGAAAITLLEQGSSITLVFSDVVMTGGISGFDLARWLAQHRPEVSILLTSGFSAEALEDKAGESSSLRILRKPYNRRELSNALRQAVSTLPAKT
jgi:CheY-like chemotaxis protein